VLTGSSINAEYVFSNITKINHHFYLGELSSPVVRKLTQGTVETIYSGKRFIHAAFHLEKPTVSIVVRSHQDDDAMPQFEYRGKHLRIVRDFVPEFAKKIQALRFLEAEQHDKFRDCFMDTFINSPTDDRYWLARAFYMNLRKDDKLWNFLLNFRKQETMRKIIDSIEEERLLIQGVKLRSKIQDPDLKYFIALLLNIPTWNGLLEFQRKQDGNIASVQRWLDKAHALGFDLQQLSGFTNKGSIINAGLDTNKRLNIIFNELLRNRIGQFNECIPA